jgi:ketosteroid isomerase-like protein
MRDDTDAAVLDRLAKATNAHDVDAIVDCFTEDYRNETPAHPARSFVGRDQVRRNWTQILAALPDLRVEVTARALAGEDVWSEWRHTGTRPDGSPHLMCGVIIMQVRDGRASSARFYLEPVDADTATVDVAVRRQVAGSAGS